MTDNKQNLVILGSTGSVGVNTLDVVARHPDKFSVVALTARHQVDSLFEQCLRFKPKFAVMLQRQAAAALARKFAASGADCVVLSGVEALEKVGEGPRAAQPAPRPRGPARAHPA